MGGGVLGYEKILIADTSEDKLILISLENFTVEKNIDLCKLKVDTDIELNLENDKFGPFGIYLSEDKYIYVTNCYDNSVMKIDLNQEKILEILKVGKNPTSLESFDGKIYIANSDSNTISVVDEKSFSLLENIVVGERPTDIKIDETNGTLFVANGNCFTISMIDLNSKTINSIVLGMHPIKIIYEDDRFFVLSYMNNEKNEYTNLSEIQINDFKVIMSIDLKGIFSDFKKIKGKEKYYLTNMEDGSVYIIDAKLKEDKMESTKIFLGGMPNEIILDNSNIIISNILTGEIIIMDEKTNRVKDKIRVGNEPNGIILL